MNILKLLFIVATCYHVAPSAHGFELKSLKFLINILSGEFMESKRDDKPDAAEEDTVSSAYIISRGQTDYSFVDFITYADENYCLPYEYTDLSTNSGRSQLRESSSPNAASSAKPPLRVQCITGVGNGTTWMTNSMKDIVQLLAPHGNNTKRTERGNCAIVLFYSKSCPFSAKMGTLFNPIASQFPDLRVGAIDAVKYHVLNTEFGIVGLPTIMLFHQGRPLIRYTTIDYFRTSDNMKFLLNMALFVTEHTSIRALLEEEQPIHPISSSLIINDTFNWDDFRTPFTGEYEYEPDWCLWLAWSFIGICSCFYFTKTKWYASIVEVAKRNWRESEAQHEHIR